MLVLWKPEGGRLMEGTPATRGCLRLLPRDSHFNLTGNHASPMLTVTEATSSLPKEEIPRKYAKIGDLFAIPVTRQGFHGDPGALLRPHPLLGLKQEEFWVAL